MSIKPLKRFTSTNDVTLDYLIEALEAWEKGEVSREDMMVFAEYLYELGPGFPSYPADDVRSIIMNVLDALAMMYTDPTIPSDIPALKQSLHMARTSPSEAIDFLHSYWESVDWDTRVQKQHDQIQRGEPDKW